MCICYIYTIFGHLSTCLAFFIDIYVHYITEKEDCAIDVIVNAFS